ncbi:MAG: TonB-dependent receptor, partial [Alistipes sp.]|nr:TonB-dependent receptor [Alistipes sp.]
RHRLSLTAFGAPQWHNQRYNKHQIEDYHTNPDGRRMNMNYGYMGGEVLSSNYNVYHKPQISLVHTWNIDSKSLLSTSVYASIARGGGRTAMGTNPAWMRVGNDGRPTADSRRTSDGLIDWNSIFDDNRANPNGSSAAFAMMNNSHDWYGILSSYNNQINDEIKITAGFDGRYYKGYHQEEIENLLGGSYIIDNRLETRPANTQLRPGDLNYDEIGWVARAGVFAQAEYLKDNFSAFLSGSVSRHMIRWANYGTEPEAGYGMLSDWLGFTPWSIKGGASYKMGLNHSVFANAGYFTIAPIRANAFPNYATVPNPDANMEKVSTVEAGYTFANNVLNVTLNGYYTLWLDRSQSPITEQAPDGTNITYNVQGVNARHMGLEMEATYRPTTRLTLKAMGSVGDWVWRDDVHYTAYDNNQNPIGEFTAYIGGIHVGDAAQITAAMSATWEPLTGLRVGADYNWFGKNFASFYPDTRTSLADKVEAWQLPDYGTVDASLSYRFSLGENLGATLYGNVNNLLDTWYISDADDARANGGTHDAKGATVWYGFGRTWTAGLKFTF